MIPSVSQHNVQASLVTFLTAVLPSTVEVVSAAINRVPEPKSDDYVVVSPLRRTRLRTNEDAPVDAVFTGSISATTMTISAVDTDRFPDGRIEVGSRIFGTGVAANTTVTAILTGSGQIGTYTVTPSQNVASRTLSAGTKTIEQGTEFVFQLDFHTKDFSAADLAQTVSTVLRDPYGVSLFAEQTTDYGVVPLYGDDPQYRPFINAAQAYEWRWSLDVHLQANPVVTVPQEFADSAEVTDHPVL